MELSPDLRHEITEELINEFGGKMDGGRKNVLAPVCPFCNNQKKAQNNDEDVDLDLS